MFDDFVFNLKKSFRSSSVNESKSDRDDTDGSTIAFLQRSEFDLNTSNRSNLIGIFQSYFNRFNQKNVTDGNTNLMLPRVYAPNDGHCFDWDPIELKAKEKYIEDIDNVVDKFARVISVNETTSPRRNRFFYVNSFFFYSPQTTILINMLFYGPIRFRRKEMIVKKFVDAWRWVPKMIICQKFQQINQHESRVFIRDYKEVSTHHASLVCGEHLVYMNK